MTNDTPEVRVTALNFNLHCTCIQVIHSDNYIHALSFWGFPFWFSSIYPSGSNSFQHNETQYTIHLLSQLLVPFQGQVLGSWSQSQHALGKGKGSLWAGYQYTPSERLVGQLKNSLLSMMASFSLCLPHFFWKHNLALTLLPCKHGFINSNVTKHKM